jgi:hypothetical protein
MEFKCDRRVAKGPDGTVGQLVEWREANTAAEWLLLGIGRLAFGGALMSLVSGAIFGLGYGPPAFILCAMLAAVLLAVAWMFVWIGWRVPGKRKWLLFGENGAIESYDAGLWKRTQVADIANVEWEQLKQKKEDDLLSYTHGVRITTRSGRVLRVAKNLEPDDATEVVVAISDAVEEVLYAKVESENDGGVFAW